MPERQSRLYAALVLELGWNQGAQLSLNLRGSQVRKDFGVLLGRDNLLQN